MITIPIRRGAERIAVEIDGRHANAMFGPVELWMLAEEGAGINLGPFAQSVPATMPDAKPVEKERGRKRGRDLEHEPVDALI
jgi:hypothetical protein